MFVQRLLIAIERRQNANQRDVGVLAERIEHRAMAGVGEGGVAGA